MNGIPIQEVKKSNKSILLIENEGSGISNDLEKFIDKKISIPRFGKAESLNAAVACGILTHQLCSY
jgi:TrmH family RNA methyltransferase